MAERVKRLMLVTGSCMVLTALSACGPSLYTFHSIPASSVVEQARAADAAELAPYEFYAAESYLVKAREEAAEANYQDAIRFAERASELGEKARDLARQRRREQGR